MDNPVRQKPRIVIIGAGMAGLTAANKLYMTSTTSDQHFELCVVDGGSRIGGRIYTSEFCGDPIELGATWIHGTQGNPIYRIAKESGLLHSQHPWEYMDGDPQDPQTLAEGGHELDSSIVGPISALFNNLMDSIRGKAIAGDAARIAKHCDAHLGVGSFLRKGLEVYWGLQEEEDERKVGKWSRKSLEEAIFAMHESTHMTFTSADDLRKLDYEGESKYEVFPGEEISIAGGYSGVIQSLASVLPVGMIQFRRKVDKIEWNQRNIRPVKLHFSDGSALWADHVIVTVSLGVLKDGIRKECKMFEPELPSSKTEAISKLGYGLVDKVFLQLPSGLDFEFPFIQMVFHPLTSEERNANIPRWMRKASWCYPIYSNSGVVVSWFTGQDAYQIEAMTEEDIADGFSETLSDLLSTKLHHRNGVTESRKNGEILKGKQLKFSKVLRSRWGSDPLFLGSYSYVAVGSSGDDIDALSEPLPESNNSDDSAPKLQIMFAGEATHTTLYSTTHGAYFSGLREANRLLKHYNLHFP